MEHLVHKQKMASILASPQVAKKKRFVKLEWGSLEASLPTGANPFQDPKVAGSTAQRDSRLNPGCVEIEGSSPPSILTTHPILMLIGGIFPHNSEPDQGLYKGSIGQEVALRLGTYV
jgi:hypothetical protein